MAITLYKQTGWIDTIRGLEKFHITPEIRAQGTISKGVTDAPAKSGGTKAEPRDHFIVHFEPECRVSTKTDPGLLKMYGVTQPKLKQLHVSIPSPDLCFNTGRFKYGKRSGVLCSSDDNVKGKPLMDIKNGNTIVLHQGAEQRCQECPFNADGSCKETMLVLFTISAPTDDQTAPFGNMLFKLSLPYKARNPFMGNYALAMSETYTTVLQYGLDHQHFPQSMIPFKLSLVERPGQYYDAKKKSQVKTSYYLPEINLDSERLHARLAQMAERFHARQLSVMPEQKSLVSEIIEEEVTRGWEPAGPDIGDGDNMPLSADGAGKQIELNEVRQNIRKLWEKYDVHPAAADNSFKKFCREDGRSETTITLCDDLEFLKAYGKYKQAKLKAEAAAKSERAKAGDEAEALKRQNAEEDRVWLVENLLNLPVVKKQEIIEQYDAAMEKADWKTCLNIINEQQD